MEVPLTSFSSSIEAWPVDWRWKPMSIFSAVVVAVVVETVLDEQVWPFRELALAFLARPVSLPKMSMIALPFDLSVPTMDRPRVVREPDGLGPFGNSLRTGPLFDPT